MEADGSGRNRLGGDGRPKWSDDGHQFLICTFESPRTVTLLSVKLDRRNGLCQQDMIT